MKTPFSATRLLILAALIVLIAAPVAAQTRTFTIAGGASLSDAIDMQSCTSMRMMISPPWATANLTFQNSDDNGDTYGNLYDESGNEVTITVPAASATLPITIRMSAGDWWSWRYLKIRSGTSGTAVNQGTAAGSISAVSNAATVALTSATHGLLTGNTVTISGGTGNWVALNGTWTITRTDANNFTVPLNSTALGAKAGTIVFRRDQVIKIVCR